MYKKELYKYKLILIKLLTIVFKNVNIEFIEWAVVFAYILQVV